MTASVKMLTTLTCSPGLKGRRGLRPLFWGPPGVGKTAAIESLAESLGIHVITIIASLREPSDFLGLPIPDGKGGFTYAAPAWARQANAVAAKGQLVLIFLDELSTSPPAVQAALLRVVNEGWVGELSLHPNVTFAAAANPPEIAAGGFDLTAPFSNRWIHLQWDAPSVIDWADGVLSDWASAGVQISETAADVMARMEKTYQADFARAKGLVTGFLRRSGQHLFAMPETGSNELGGAWASPRSWDMAIRALAGARANQLPEDEEDLLLQGTIGLGIAGELRAYQAEADLPDMEKLLDANDPEKIWVHNPMRPDLTQAVFDGCTALVTPKDAKHRVKRAQALWMLFDGVVDDAADVAVSSARALVRAGLTAGGDARKIMRKMGPVLKAMGALNGGR